MNQPGRMDRTTEAMPTPARPARNLPPALLPPHPRAWRKHELAPLPPRKAYGIAQNIGQCAQQTTPVRPARLNPPPHPSSPSRRCPARTHALPPSRRCRATPPPPFTLVLPNDAREKDRSSFTRPDICSTSSRKSSNRALWLSSARCSSIPSARLGFAQSASTARAMSPKSLLPANQPRQPPGHLVNRSAQGPQFIPSLQARSHLEPSFGNLLRRLRHS